MKTLKQLIDEKVALMHPFRGLPVIQESQLMEAVTEWLGQWRSDPKGIQTVDEVGQIQLEFLEELERYLGEAKEGQ
jgi:hypothetical protein